MKIAIGSDHAGFETKEKIKNYFADEYIIIDYGTYSLDSVDYPIFGHKVAKAVSNQKTTFGIVICGSGIGISIAANKVRNIRAALCTSPEHAEMSRKHNDANILALGARMTSFENIISILERWLETSFDGGRHQNRINQIEINE